MMSRFVQFDGLVCFFWGNILTSKGSRISHSESVKLLEYGILIALKVVITLLHHRKRCQMGSIAKTPKSDCILCFT